MARRRGGAACADRAASLLEKLNARHPWDHNAHFHSWVLANLPDPCRSALDVGCGRGELAAALAPHVARVVGNDVDVAVREQAARRCAGLREVEITGDDWTAGDETFDLVTMVAVLHHLDVAPALHAVRRRLTPGGRFLAVGLAPPTSPCDHAWELASVVTNPLIGWAKHPWPHRDEPSPAAPVPVRDPTLPFDELARVLRTVMPGAVLRHRLGFRHTVSWTEPA